MEGILGIGSLTQFDAFSTPMFAAFTDKPDLTPYQAASPSYDMKTLNTPKAPMAKESGEQDTTKEDDIDEQVFTKAIWKAVKGARSTMPEPKHSVIQSGPVLIYDDDDDEGEKLKPGDVDLDELGSYSKDAKGFPVWTPDDKRFDPAQGIDPCSPKPGATPTVPTAGMPSNSSHRGEGRHPGLPRTGV